MPWHVYLQETGELTVKKKTIKCWHDYYHNRTMFFVAHGHALHTYYMTREEQKEKKIFTKCYTHDFARLLTSMFTRKTIVQETKRIPLDSPRHSPGVALL